MADQHSGNTTVRTIRESGKKSDAGGRGYILLVCVGQSHRLLY